MGFRTPVTLQSPDYFATMLCHELLGQSPISRLFVHVREAHSLCYSISSRYRMLQGEVTVACGISAENREKAESAIMEQIEVLKRGEFTEAEWLAAKKSLIGSCRQLEDSTRSLSDFYKVRLPLCPDHTPAEYVARFENVTRREVMDAAEKLRLDMVYFRQGTGEDEEDGDD
jgi:predicted Zn-dependent peptidase